MYKHLLINKHETNFRPQKVLISALFYDFLSLNKYGNFISGRNDSISKENQMYFNRQSFHKSIKGYLVFLPTILAQNWSGEFFGMLDDVRLISARNWRKFGNFLGQFWNWCKYKPENIAEFLFSAIWFIWLLFVIFLKITGAVFKVFIWLFILPIPWLLFSITSSIKLNDNFLQNIS